MSERTSDGTPSAPAPVTDAESSVPRKGVSATRLSWRRTPAFPSASAGNYSESTIPELIACSLTSVASPCRPAGRAAGPRFIAGQATHGWKRGRTELPNFVCKGLKRILANG